jgi:hypothetical protein
MDGTLRRIPRGWWVLTSQDGNTTGADDNAGYIACGGA